MTKKDNKPSEKNPEQDLDALVMKVSKAQEAYASFTQEQVDEIVFRASIAANQARISLAKTAVAETGRGVVEDKVIKNHFAAEFVYNKYRQTKTCGVISSDPAQGLHKIATPVGVIAGIVPVTNPTSTTIFKACLALKTRNAIIFSPHPNAKQCSIDAARVVYEAAVKAGAPKNIIGWIDTPSVALSKQLMGHAQVQLILATGGPGMVKSAYSSGTPAIGVGPGNVPVVIDETADIANAASSIIHSKAFDYGMICASEQSAFAVKSIYAAFKKQLIKYGAYCLKRDEQKKIARVIMVNGHLNPNIVGQSPQAIANMAGVSVPASARILVAEVKNIGTNEPYSIEKLSPVLALYQSDDFEKAVSDAKRLINFGGLGHSAVIYTAESNQDRIAYFSDHVVASRLLVNMPSSQGAIGDIYNFSLTPSLTLGCGSYGNNSVSENIGVNDLINIKTVVERRENMLWMRVPPKIYFKRGCLGEAFKDFAGKKRALVMTDQALFDLGHVKKVTDKLNEMGITHQVFSDIQPDPDLSTVMKGVRQAQQFKPDLLIALGGGSPMDAGKIIWLLYEHPETKFDELALRFADIRKRICPFPTLGEKAAFVAIPTTSGTGSECTPFAVITDDKTGIKYPIADYALTPDMAIIDPDFVMHMPKGLTAAGGYDAVSHAVEAMVAVTATDYTEPLALKSLKMLFDYLPAAYHEGAKNPLAREKVHYAASIAGMAFANAMLGINHSLAHKLGSAFHIPHGVANALVLPLVVKFNATDAPRRQGTFSQYRVPAAIERYAKIADALGLGGKTNEDKVNRLIKALEDLRKTLGIPATIKAWGISKKAFYEKLDAMSELAFDDQCTGTNPRYPSIEELRGLYIEAFGE
jgi:acetaldehyde dehydrogenase / alcohol dehydrogenase